MWTWVAITTIIIVVTLGAAAVINRAGPYSEAPRTETLSTKFDGRGELDNLSVSVLRGLAVSGDRLRIFPPDSVVAADANQPLIAVEHFSFHSGLVGLFVEPIHVRSVHVYALEIDIPPREMRRPTAVRSDERHGTIKILVDELICDNSRLIIGTGKPGKDPKDFDPETYRVARCRPKLLLESMLRRSRMLFLAARSTPPARSDRIRWQLSGIVKAVSGSVFELHAGGSSSSNLNATSGNDRRSDIVKPSVDVSGQVGPGTTWFDTTAFAPVTDLNRFGTSPFYLLHGPGLSHRSAVGV